MKALTELPNASFQSKHVVDRWLDLFKEHPFGDYYRLSTINPLILQIALWAKQRQKHANIPPPPLDLGTATFVQFAADRHDPCAAFEAFHRSILQQAKSDNAQPLTGLRIVDFGCGNGYLAPLLSALGANYCGLDKQPGFISFAKQNCKEGASKRFAISDLDKTRLSQLRPSLGSIDLALSVMVLEHLNDPLALLQQLRLLSVAATPPPALLLVTENPRYYGEALPHDGDNGRYLRTTNRVPIVCLEGTAVDVTCRDHNDVAVLLRDAGYTVLEECYHRLPSKWDDFPRKHYKCEELAGVNWGLAPFRSILAVPLPKPQNEGRVTFSELVDNTVLKHLKGGSQKSLLGEIQQQGTFVRLIPRQPLLTRRDLGGCLFIVTDGLLCSEDQPEAVFEQFSCFGELEANRGSASTVHCGFFVHDVSAGEAGAEVFVIPERIASKLLASGGSLVSMLFSELRKKLLLRNDRVTLRSFADSSYNSKNSKRTPHYISPDLKRVRGDVDAPDRPEIPESLVDGLVLKTTKIPFDKIQKYDLGRFAGALLNLSEIESQANHRAPETRAVFCDLERLQSIADIRDSTENTGAKFLRFLSALGVLDGIPVKMLRHFRDGANTRLDIRLATDLVSYIQKRAFIALNAMVTSGNISHMQAGVCNANVVELAAKAREGECFRKTQGKRASQTTGYFNAMQNLVSECWRTLETLEPTLRSEALKPVLQAANRLLQLNIVIKDEKPRFFVLHDLPFLRTLAYAPDEEVDRSLIVRALAQRRTEVLQYNSFEVIATQLARADDAHGRIRYYAAAFTQFLKDDWDNQGRLRYSGGGDQGVDLPQSITL